MNLLLLDPEEVNADMTASISGRRFEHVMTIIGAACGDTLKAGVMGGKTGLALITRINGDSLDILFALDADPPDPLPVILCMALIRPKALRRALFSAITMGIKEIHLFRSWRVDKSYFASPILSPESLRGISRLALEQARDTIPPEIYIHKGFKPFVEDILPTLMTGRTGYVLHPDAEHLLPTSPTAPALMAIGPEGGFIPYEVEHIHAAGLMAVNAGARILTAETAVTALLGRFL